MIVAFLLVTGAAVLALLLACAGTDRHAPGARLVQRGETSVSVDRDRGPRPADG